MFPHAKSFCNILCSEEMINYSPENEIEHFLHNLYLHLGVKASLSKSRTRSLVINLILIKMEETQRENI